MIGAPTDNDVKEWQLVPSKVSNSTNKGGQDLNKNNELVLLRESPPTITLEKGANSNSVEVEIARPVNKFTPQCDQTENIEESDDTSSIPMEGEDVFSDHIRMTSIASQPVMTTPIIEVRVTRSGRKEIPSDKFDNNNSKRQKGGQLSISRGKLPGGRGGGNKFAHVEC